MSPKESAAVTIAAILFLVMALALGSSITDGTTSRQCNDFGKTKLNGVIYACSKVQP